MKLCAKFGLYRPSGSKEDDKMLKFYDDNKNINELIMDNCNGHISIHQLI